MGIIWTQKEWKSQIEFEKSDVQMIPGPFF